MHFSRGMFIGNSFKMDNPSTYKMGKSTLLYHINLFRSACVTLS
eukprot:UN12137